MAYENMTYEFILQRMMNRVKEKHPNLDTREGSIIFNALAPAAVELAIMYTELEDVRKESFAGTASRENLLLLCEQVGIDTSEFEATASTHIAQFDRYVPIGSRWSYGTFNFVVTEFIGGQEYEFWFYVKCETKGSAPNAASGYLLPIAYHDPYLNVAILHDTVIPGKDEATVEEIRDAYFNLYVNEASDGNLNFYYGWCKQASVTTGYPIGKMKVFPLWDGLGTVKVSILNSENRAADEGMIENYQIIFDPDSTGMGDGLAPIGAKVTVSTATEVPINISAKIRWENNQPNPEKLNEALTNCFAKLAYVRDFVDHYDIANAMMDSGVVSITDLTVNGSKDVAVVLGEEEIPVLGTTTWTVN